MVHWYFQNPRLNHQCSRDQNFLHFHLHFPHFQKNYRHYFRHHFLYYPILLHQNPRLNHRYQSHLHSRHHHCLDHRLEVEIPAEHRGLIIPKGSICLDGISLTAAEVTASTVVCWIIPHTFQLTNLHTKKAGDRLNVEFDMLGKYVRELMRQQPAA